MSILINDKSGSFVTTPIPTTPSGGVHPVFVVAPNLNSADVCPDLAVVNQNSENVVVILNKGDGTFPTTVSPYIYTTGPQPHGIAYGQFTMSGLNDLAVANIGTGSTQGMVQVFLNEDCGVFCPLSAIPAGNQPHAVSAADFTGDGVLDLLVANGGNSDTQVTLLKGIGGGDFHMRDCPTHCYTTGLKPVNLAVGDFNGDGKEDFASANLKDTSGSATVGFQNSSGGFTLQSVPIDSSDCTAGSNTQYVSDVTVGELKGDGVEDLVVTNFCQNSVTIFPYDSGSGQFCTTIPVNTLSLGMDKGPRSVVLFKLLPTDTNLAIAVANHSASTITILTLE